MRYICNTRDTPKTQTLDLLDTLYDMKQVALVCQLHNITIIMLECVSGLMNYKGLVSFPASPLIHLIRDYAM